MSGLVLVLLAVTALEAGREPDFREPWAVRESLSQVHPRLRSRWLHERGIDLDGLFKPSARDSGPLRLRGKWGRGPSVEVTGRDTIVFLSLGSEVAILSFASPDSPRVIAEVQAAGLAVQAAVRDSFLYVGVSTGVPGLEVWNVGDLAHPVFRGRADTRLTDFCILDTLAFVTSRMGTAPSRDTFKVYSLSDPQNPQLVGSRPDSGHAVTVAGSTVIQADWHDVHIIDVSDPTNPVRAGTYPSYAVSVAARGTICCAAFELSQSPPTHRFVVLDITDPANPQPVGSLNGAGAYDIALADTLAFLSGFESDFPFRIVDISDSTQPRSVGAYDGLTQCYGVWGCHADGYALVADAGYGLAVFDIEDPGVPALVTRVAAASFSMDVSLDGHYAYVASYEAGMHALDVTDPASILTLGNYDTAGVRPAAEAVVARDSFAFMPWFSARMFRSVDITDRTVPKFAGESDGPGPAKDMVLRDSLVYQCSNTRFAVYNVARPREPVLVGSCNIQGTGTDLLLRDTLAYVSSLPGQVIDVSDPTAPQVIGSMPLCTYGIVIIDTFALAPDGGDSLWVLSVRDPTSPRRLSCIPLTGIPQYTNDIELMGTKAYTAGSYIHVFDVSDPAQPRDLAKWRPPYVARRIVADGQYIYAACWDAGVCIYETTQVSIAETAPGGIMAPGVLIGPNPTRGAVNLAGLEDGRVIVQVFDVAGKEVMSMKLHSSGGTPKVDLSTLPSGLYFLDARSGSKGYSGKVIKR